MYLGFRNVNELAVTIHPDKYFKHYFFSFMLLVLGIEPRCLFHARQVPYHQATPPAS